MCDEQHQIKDWIYIKKQWANKDTELIKRKYNNKKKKTPSFHWNIWHGLIKASMERVRHIFRPHNRVLLWQSKAKNKQQTMIQSLSDLSLGTITEATPMIHEGESSIISMAPTPNMCSCNIKVISNIKGPLTMLVKAILYLKLFRFSWPFPPIKIKQTILIYCFSITAVFAEDFQITFWNCDDSQSLLKCHTNLFIYLFFL